MSTYRTDPKTGQTLITPGNKVDPKDKSGKTYNELGTKPPKQPPPAEGDPEEAGQHEGEDIGGVALEDDGW